MGADNHPTVDVQNANNEKPTVYTVSVLDPDGNQVGQFKQTGRKRVIAQNRAWKVITDNPENYGADHRRELSGYSIDMTPE